jgi:hypothetical protein
MKYSRVAIASFVFLACIMFGFGGYLISEYLCENHCDAKIKQIEENKKLVSAQKILDFSNSNKASFCDLTESERLAVCPTYRLVEIFPDNGGTITTYVCDPNTAYAETYNLSASSKRIIENKLDAFRITNSIAGHCETKNGMVYKIERKTQNEELY